MDEWVILNQRLPEALSAALMALDRDALQNLQEIRAYAHACPEFVIDGVIREIPVHVDMEELIACLSAQALYSCERQMAEGYISLAGGHRAGVCGRMTRQSDGSWRMTDVFAVCIRISRPIPGASAAVRSFLLDEKGSASRVLVLGAPGSGKTTLLRDAALFLAQQGLHVAVADEREELFGKSGEHARLSVLSGMDKAHAFSMLLRTMAPHVMISDEIGSEADVQAVLDTVRCGVGLLLSAHARSMEEAMRRPVLCRLIEQRAFDWYILLGRHAEVTDIYDAYAKRWEGKKHGQLGYCCDGDDCHQRGGISDFGWRKAAGSLGARDAPLPASHGQHDPL